MTRLLTFSLAIALAAPLAAQDADKPLGELLEVLPPSEQEAAEEEAAEPAPLPSPPTVAPGSVATTELPASDLEPAFGAAEIGVEPAAPPTEADAAWAAMLERRRQEVNAIEAPRVAELNHAVEARIEEAERRDAEARADYERRLAEHDAEVRRAEAEHQEAMARHREAIARQRAQYQACLAGDPLACPSR